MMSDVATAAEAAGGGHETSQSLPSSPRTAQPPTSSPDAVAVEIEPKIVARAQRQRRRQQRQLASLLASGSDYGSNDPAADGVPALSSSLVSSLAAVLQSVRSLAFSVSSPPSLHLAELESSCSPHTLLLSALPLSEVREREQAVLAAQQEEKRRRTRDFIDKLKRLAVIEEEELSRLQAASQQRQRQLQSDSLLMAAEAERMKAEQRLAMRKLSNRLRAIVKAQRETVEAVYGRLRLSGHLSLPSSLPSLPSLPPLSAFSSLSSVAALLPSSPFSSRVPRLLSIRVHSLRAIKNKLPAGEYCILCTLVTGIASWQPHAHPGRVVRQRRLPLKSGGGGKVESLWVRHYDWTREPQRHSGRHYATELSFSGGDNALHIALPALEDGLLSLCLLFELIALRPGDDASKQQQQQQSAKPGQQRSSGGAAAGDAGKAARSASQQYAAFYRSDAVVAFGCLPIMHPVTAEAVSGKMKFPLLRGRHEGDHVISRHQQLHETVDGSLDRWLCNAYAELTEMPVRRRGGYWLMDGDDDERSRLRAREEMRRREQAQQRAVDLEAKRRLRDEQHNQGWGGFFKGLKKQPATLSSDAAETAAGDGAAAEALSGKIDLMGRSLHGLESSAEGKELQKRQQVREKIRELRQYRQSVMPNNRQHLELLPVASSRSLLFSFLLRESWNQIKYRQGAEAAALLNIALLVLAFLLRIGAHYVAQYTVITRVLQLDVASISIYAPLSAVFQLSSGYDATALARCQVLLCVAGPFGCSLLLMFVSLLFALLQAASIPVHGLCFTLTLLYAALSVLDPLWILLVDAMASRLSSNEYVLLFQYYSALQEPFTPLLLLLPFALLLLVLPGLLLLLYLLRVHHHRELHDLFVRLHQGEGRLPLPKDVEVSQRLVRAVLRESAQWRGAGGGRRKVMLNEYWRRAEAAEATEQEGAQAERCLHLSIFTVTKRKTVEREKSSAADADDPPSAAAAEEKEAALEDADDEQQQGQQAAAAALLSDSAVLRDSDREDRELYRHFLRLSDGSWLECLDGVEKYGGDALSSREQSWLEQVDKDDDREREEDDRRGRDQEEEEQRLLQHQQLHGQEESGADLRVRTVPRVSSFSGGGGPDGRQSLSASRPGFKQEREEKEAIPMPSQRGAATEASAESALAANFLSAGGVAAQRVRMPSLLHQTIAEDDNERDDEDDGDDDDDGDDGD